MLILIIQKCRKQGVILKNRHHKIRTNKSERALFELDVLRVFQLFPQSAQGRLSVKEAKR